MDNIPPRDRATAQARGPVDQLPSWSLLAVCVPGRTLPQPSKATCSRKRLFLFIFLKRVELGSAFCRVPPAHKLIPKQFSQSWSLR